MEPYVKYIEVLRLLASAPGASLFSQAKCGDAPNFHLRVVNPYGGRSATLAEPDRHNIEREIRT
jgi:hypothetical protein